jgi:hypothetical protein
MTALRTLIAGFIDYAGLFPPAALDMPRAVRNYAAYRHGEYGWALGRFILPGARIAEFEQAAEQVGTSGGSGAAWSIALSAGADAKQEIERLQEFNRRHSSANNGFAIDTFEIRVQRAEEIPQIARLLPQGIAGYFEIPLSPSLPEMLSAMAATGTRAKFRTGGLTAGMFPLSSDLARFMQSCLEAKVAFKASAGLHHPVRSVHPFTYEPNSPSGVMHGFINVFLAAALLRADGSADEAVALLEETSALSFRFDEQGASWLTHRLTRAQLEETRRHFALSVGSCSFEEPLADLRKLGWL